MKSEREREKERDREREREREKGYNLIQKKPSANPSHIDIYKCT